MGKPEQVFKAGAVRASVFVNAIERNGTTLPIRKVVIEVRYRDKTGQWQGTNSLSLNEVPKAITALQHAYEYMLSQGSQEPSGQVEPPPMAGAMAQPTMPSSPRWPGMAPSMDGYAR